MNGIKKDRIAISLLPLLVLLLAIFVPQRSFAKDKDISIELHNAPLLDGMNEIERQTKYLFVYDKNCDLAHKVSLTLKAQPLETALQQLFAGSGLSWRIDGGSIIISPEPRRQTNKTKTKEPVSSGKTTIKGKIIDDEGEPVIGAIVTVKGTRNGTTTDINGEYTLEISPDDNPQPTINVRFLGYEPAEKAADGKHDVDFVLHDKSSALDEVVVIGYGTQTKASVTGALSTVDTEALVKAPVASITNVLSGAVPGVATVQTSGQPGADAAAIYIRGVGTLNSALASPLILVDGVEREFSQIDPNEIENFSVLKDAASTAVFGVRGANGVILITTRRGKEGRPSVSFSSITGLQQPISYVEQTNSYEFARFWNIKMENDGITDRTQYFTREAIEAYRTGSDPIMYPNVKWHKKMFNDVFLQTKNNLNISGGSKNIRYFVSLGYLFQNGLLKQTKYLNYDNNYKYNRFNYRTNLDFDITRSTVLKVGIGGNVGVTQNPLTIADGNEWVYATIWAVPMAGPGFINGKRTLIPKGFVPSSIELRDGYSTFFGQGYQKAYHTTLNCDAEFQQKLDFIAKGLSISLKGAYDNSFNMAKVYATNNWRPEYQYAYYKSYLEDKTKLPTDPDYDKTIVFIPAAESSPDFSKDQPLAYQEKGYGRDRNWYIEAKLSYARSFGPNEAHKVTALLLYNQSRDYYPNVGSSAYAYIPRSYLGYVARATYGYRSKYLIDLNIGYNGSENFAPGRTRYGAFPSASIGWVVSSEEFMGRQDAISHLKLRASWGRVGNDRSGQRFMYMPSVWAQSGSYSFGINNASNMEAYAEGTLGNHDVTWETADKQNYGIDLSFFPTQKLSLNVDYFTEKRTGILITPNSTPSIISATLPALNIGRVDNRGYEIALGWKDGTSAGFNYYISANMSYAHNKIIYMDEVASQYAYQNQTGGPTGRYTGLYKFERLYQSSDFVTNDQGQRVLNPALPQPYVAVEPGDAMYADLNGDGIVDNFDTMVTGYSARPEYVFGLNAGFNWRGFNFSMQWTGATHVNKMMEIEYRIPFTNAGGRGLLKYFYQDCWTPEHTDAKLPRAAEKSEVWNSSASTLWLRDASYIRLKTLSIGYSFSGNQHLLKAGIKNLGISFSGYNLLTFSPMDFADPESLTTNNGAYPLVKVYSLTLNINF